MDVLVEEVNPQNPDLVSGKLSNNLTVHFPGDASLIGRILPVYLGTITRNLSLSRCRAANTQKRGHGKLALVYEELQESVPGGTSPEEQVILRELGSCIDQFLRKLPPRNCCIFLRRYWYMDTTLQIAARYGMTESGVKVNLHRTRKQLRAYLEQEGFGR